MNNIHGDRLNQDRLTPARVHLTGKTDGELVDLLGHDNDWFVRHARRLLQERAAAGRLAFDTPRLLREKLATATTTPKKLRFIWALHVTARLDEAALARLLDDPDPAVRGWAIQLAAERKNVSQPLLERFAGLAASDPSPVVRLALASALQRVSPPDLWPIAAALVGHADDANDHNLPLMNWYAIEPLVPLDPAWALDLAAANRADLEYLLANLLDPSAIVGRDYQTTIVVTGDGRSIAGIVVQETPTSVTLQTPTERVTVPLDEIQTRVLATQSLMPENQLAQLSPEAARDLVAYLRHATQVPLPAEASPSHPQPPGPGASP
jgi:putative heme-binding domain-containing protein